MYGVFSIRHIPVVCLQINKLSKNKSVLIFLEIYIPLFYSDTPNKNTRTCSSFDSMHPPRGCTLRSALASIIVTSVLLLVRTLGYVRSYEHHRLGGGGNDERSGTVRGLTASGLHDSDVRCHSTSSYHTVLVASSSRFEQWQATVVYHHWNRSAGACTQTAGFTRLCVTPGGQPDGLQDEIPTLFLKRTAAWSEATRAEMIKYLAQSSRMGRIRRYSSYVLLLQCNVIPLQPLPPAAAALMKRGSANALVAFAPSITPMSNVSWRRVEHRIRAEWPAARHEDVPPIRGSSPILVHLDRLDELASAWYRLAILLRDADEADAAAAEFTPASWSYAIAAASLGLRHEVMAGSCAVGGIRSGTVGDSGDTVGDAVGRIVGGAVGSIEHVARPLAPQGCHMLCYEPRLDFAVDGSPCAPGTVGDWSLDLSRIAATTARLPYPLPSPPKTARDATATASDKAMRERAGRLIDAWNEAIQSRPLVAHLDSTNLTFPAGGGTAATATNQSVQQGVYGWRRSAACWRSADGFARDKRESLLVRQMVGQQFQCMQPSRDASGAAGRGPSDRAVARPIRMLLTASGHFHIGRSTGRWGLMNDPWLGTHCPVSRCLYTDTDETRVDAHVQFEAAGRQHLTLYRSLYETATREEAERPILTCEGVDPHRDDRKSWEDGG